MSEILNAVANSRAARAASLAVVIGICSPALAGCSDDRPEKYKMPLQTIEQLATGAPIGDVHADSKSVDDLANTAQGTDAKLDKTILFNALAEISSTTAHIPKGGSQTVTEALQHQQEKPDQTATTTITVSQGRKVAGYLFGKDGKLRATYLDHTDADPTDSAYYARPATTTTTIFSSNPLAQSGIDQTQIKQKIEINPYGLSTLTTTISSHDVDGTRTTVELELDRDDSTFTSDSDNITINGKDVDRIDEDEMPRVSQAISAAKGDIAAMSDGVLIPVPEESANEINAMDGFDLSDKIEVAKDGICAPDSDARTHGHIGEADCIILPSVLEGSDIVAPSDFVDGIATGDLIDDEDLVDSLPPLHALAFKKALVDGDDTEQVTTRNWITAKTANRYEDQLPGAGENAEYLNGNAPYGKDSTTAAHGYISYIIDPSEAASQMYPTLGAYTNILRHEGAHSMFQQWLNHLGDPETKEQMDILDTNWQIQATDFLGQYYDQNAEQDKLEIDLLLQSLRARSGDDKIANLTLKHLSEYQASLARRDSYIQKQIKIPGEYDKHNLFITYPIDYIRSVATDYALDQIFTEEERRLFDALTDRLSSALLDRFAFVHESTLLVGAQNAGGHAGDATTEWVASSYAIIQTNPKGYIDSINAQSTQTRIQTVQMLQAMVKLLNRWQPHMAETKNVARVASQINIA